MAKRKGAWNKYNKEEDGTSGGSERRALADPTFIVLSRPNNLVYAVKMSSVRHLKAFISQRLTAAAEEIFSEFEKTIVQYEEEIDRQRRLLDITWKPKITLNAIELPKHYIPNDQEVLTNEVNHKKNSSSVCGEPEPLQVKEEQEELCIGTEEEQSVLMPEINTFKVISPSEDSDSDLNEDQPASLDSAAAEGGDQETDRHKLHRNLVKNPDQMDPDNRGHPGCADSPQISTKKFFKCEFFGKNFRSKSKMRKNFGTHMSEKPYVCNVCGKRFSHVSTLKVHSRIHTGEGLWFCKICGRGFTRRDILRLHMRIHTGEKPYFCETCGKSFRHSGTLTDHVRTHTGERPFSCHVCWKSFTYKRGLTVHMRTHSAENLYSVETW
ncbi:uncharacterized protein ACNS7B_004277 [Menidia menidia]